MPDIKYVFTAQDRTRAVLNQIRTRIGVLARQPVAVPVTVKATGIAAVKSALTGIPDEEVNVAAKATGIAAVKSALTGIPDEEVNVAAKATGIAAVKSALTGIPDEEVNVAAKATGIAAVKSALTGIPDEEVNVAVKATGIAAVKSQLTGIPDEEVIVNVTQQRSGAPGAGPSVPGIGRGAANMLGAALPWAGPMAAGWAAVKAAGYLHGEAADEEQMAAHVRASLREDVSDDQMDALVRQAEEMAADAPVDTTDVLLLMATLARNNRTYDELLSPLTGSILAMTLSTAIPGLTAEQAIATGTGMSADLATDAMDIFGLSAKEAKEIADLVTGFTGTSKSDLGGFGYYMAEAGAVAETFGMSFEDFVTMGSATMPYFKSPMGMGTSAKQFFLSSTQFGEKDYETLQRRGLVAEGSETFDEEGNVIGYRTALVDAETGSALTPEKIGKLLADAWEDVDPDIMLGEIGDLWGSDSTRIVTALIKASESGALSTKREEVRSFDTIERAEMRYDTTLGKWGVLFGNLSILAANLGEPMLAPSKSFAEWGAEQVADLNRRLTAPEEETTPWAGTRWEATADFLVAGDSDPREAGQVWDRVSMGLGPGQSLAIIEAWAERKQRETEIIANYRRGAYATGSGGGGGAAHEVLSGQTLGGIAEDYGVDLADLIAANPNIADPDRIEVGQEINIPGSDSAYNQGQKEVIVALLPEPVLTSSDDTMQRKMEEEEEAIASGFTRPPAGAPLPKYEAEGEVTLKGKVTELDMEAVENQVIKLTADVIVNVIDGKVGNATVTAGGVGQDTSTERRNGVSAATWDAETQRGGGKQSSYGRR